jgi:hypothetical protein
LAGDVPKAPAFGQQSDGAGLIDNLLRTSEAAPLGAGSREAGMYTRNDHRPLELREHAAHLKHRPAGRRLRIKPLLV